MGCSAAATLPAKPSSKFQLQDDCPSLFKVRCRGLPAQQVICYLLHTMPRQTQIMIWHES